MNWLEFYKIVPSRKVKMSFCFVEFWFPSRNCQESRKQTVRLQLRKIKIVKQMYDIKNTLGGDSHSNGNSLVPKIIKIKFYEIYIKSISQ